MSLESKEKRRKIYLKKKGCFGFYILDRSHGRRRTNGRSARDPSKVLLIRMWNTCCMKNRLLLVITDSYRWLQVVGRAERRCSFALPKDRSSAGASSTSRYQHSSLFREATASCALPLAKPRRWFLRFGAQYHVCNDNDDDIRFRGVTDLSRGNPSCRNTREENRRPVRFFLFRSAPSRRLTAIQMPFALHRRKWSGI